MQSVFDGADIAIDAVDFLMTFLTVQAVGQKLVDRVISQLPSDSGLYLSGPGAAGDSEPERM